MDDTELYRRRRNREHLSFSSDAGAEPSDAREDDELARVESGVAPLSDADDIDVDAHEHPSSRAPTHANTFSGAERTRIGAVALAKRSSDACAFGAGEGVGVRWRAGGRVFVRIGADVVSVGKRRNARLDASELVVLRCIGGLGAGVGRVRELLSVPAPPAQLCVVHCRLRAQLA